MVRKLIDLTEDVRDGLSRLAEVRGEAESDLIARAVELYVAEALDGEAEITDPAEVAAIRAEAAGMWRDRTDIPDLRELRGEWEARLSRFFEDDE